MQLYHIQIGIATSRSLRMDFRLLVREGWKSWHGCRHRQRVIRHGWEGYPIGKPRVFQLRESDGIRWREHKALENAGRADTNAVRLLESAEERGDMVRGNWAAAKARGIARALVCCPVSWRRCCTEHKGLPRAGAVIQRRDRRRCFDTF